MKKREMKKFEKLLMAEQAHLSQGIRTIEENAIETTEIEGGGDLSSFAEAGTDTNERDTALRVASNETEWLREVSDALRRIQAGSYGKCEGCDNDIPVKRLEVQASARLCIECQSQLEKEGTL